MRITNQRSPTTSPSGTSPAESTVAGRHAALADGTPILIRRITPDDAPLLADGFARLSNESRRLRFLTSKPALSAAELRYLTEVDGHRHEALAAIDPGTGAGVGVARFVRDSEDPSRAEVAVTVTDQWQHRGLGKLLLGCLADRARAEGIHQFTALVAEENRAMQELLEGLGAPIRVSDSLGDAVEYEIDLAPEGLGAELEEALRAAASGRLRIPPPLHDRLRALVPIHLPGP